MIDDSCHVIISCHVIMVVLKILVICFIPYELEFSVFFFLFRFFGWVAGMKESKPDKTHRKRAKQKKLPATEGGGMAKTPTEGGEE